MKVTSKRDLLRLLNQERNEIGQRFQLRIATHPTNQSSFAAPFSSTVEQVDPATDKLVNGKGIFQEQKDADQTRGTGGVIIRKAYLDVHPTYEPFFRAAYSVTVYGTTGEWEVIGVTDSIGQMQIRVTLQGRQ